MLSLLCGSCLLGLYFVHLCGLESQCVDEIQCSYCSLKVVSRVFFHMFECFEIRIYTSCVGDSEWDLVVSWLLCFMFSLVSDAS